MATAVAAQDSKTPTGNTEHAVAALRQRAFDCGKIHTQLGVSPQVGRRLLEDGILPQQSTWAKLTAALDLVPPAIPLLLLGHPLADVALMPTMGGDSQLAVEVRRLANIQAEQSLLIDTQQAALAELQAVARELLAELRSRPVR